MRHALLVVTLAAIAVTLVHLRRGEVRARYEANAHRARQVALQRDLLSQQVQLGELTSPGRIRRTVATMALGLTERTYTAVAGRPGPALAQRPGQPSGQANRDTTR